MKPSLFRALRALEREIPSLEAGSPTGLFPLRVGRPREVGAFRRAGDRGRTGDVQLGKLIDEGPEDYDPWG